MRPRDEVIRDLARQWLTKADQDLAVAAHLLSEEAPFLTAAAFHAQQAAEKYLKALLVRHQVEFPKTHDLGELLDLLATADAALAQQLRAAEGLNPYAVDTRYPGDCPEMTVQDGRQAVALATQVKEQVFLRLGAYLQGPSDR